MTKKRQTYLSLTTPPGVASWPFLDTPVGKYKKPDEFEYRVDLLYDPDDPGLKDFERRIGEFIQTRLEEEGAPGDTRVSNQIKPHLKDGEPTGKIRIRIKADQTYTTKSGQVVTRRVKIVDSQKNPISPPPQIGGGSLLRVAVDVSGYFNPDLTDDEGRKTPTLFVQFRPRVAQVLDLVEMGTEVNMDDYGMDATDGFVHEPTEEDLEASPNF